MPVKQSVDCDIILLQLMSEEGDKRLDGLLVLSKSSLELSTVEAIDEKISGEDSLIPPCQTTRHGL